MKALEIIGITALVVITYGILKWVAWGLNIFLGAFITEFRKKRKEQKERKEQKSP